MTCPAGSICDETGTRCLVGAQVEACDGAAEAAACRYNGIDGICLGGICVPPHCGDGVVTGTEECDGTALGELSDCRDLGYYGSVPLVCGSDCRYDRSVCTTGLCGDGARNGPEVCDGNDLQATNCLDLGFYESGPLSCNDACSYNTSECHGSCGDGILNGPEVCEEGLPILDSCVNYGFDRGYMACSRCLPDVTSCRTIGWRNLPVSISTIIKSIHGTGRNDVYAGGSDGALLHWDGTRWTPMTPSTFDHFRAVWAFSSSHAVALGELGSIQRYNGTAWTTAFADPSWRFNGIVNVGASGTTDAFAVGNKGILRYDGTSWTTFVAPGATELVDIWGTSASNLYAVSSTGQLSYYSGASWSPVAITGSPAVTSVWGTADGTLYAGTTNGLYRRTGNTWQQLDQLIGVTFGNITAAALTSPDDFCMVGTQSTVWCYDGTYWSPLASSYDGFGDMSSVWASGPDDLFAAGTAGIQHHEGSSWFGTSYPAAPLAFWGDDNLLVAATGNIVGDSGGGQFVNVYTASNGKALYGIWGFNDSNLFAVGQAGSIVRYNGAWGTMTSSTSNVLMSVWGTALTNVYAVGNAGTIVRLTTINGPWAGVTSGTTSNLKDVWGSAASDVFAVGDGGTIVHSSTGGAFTAMTSGTTHNLRAVFGFSATNVYAVGELGTLLHYNGTSWSPVSTGTGVTLNDVWGTSANDVFVVGDLGFMYHFDGTRWSPVKRGGENQLAIYGVRNEIYVSVPGANGELLMRLAPW